MLRKRKPLSQATLDDHFIRQKRKKDDVQDVQKKPGTIVRVVLKNFMCHSYLEVNFNHNVNYIIGQNGSGKSAIMTALVVGLGGKASLTNRGNAIKDFIKAGKSSASVEVTLNNRGPLAYRYNTYKDEITIIRNFTAAGSSGYKIRSFLGEVISTQLKEIHKICANLNIQIDNPICLLNQDTSRNFLSTGDSHQKYLLFMRATGLENIYEEFKKMCINNKESIRKLKEVEAISQDLKKDLKVLEKKMNDHKSVVFLKEKSVNLQIEMSWAQVRDTEIDRNAQQHIVDTIKQELSVLEAEIANEASESTGYADSIREMQLQVSQLQASIEEQNEPQTGLVRVLGQFKESVNEKQREKRAIAKDIALKTGNCKILQDEIDNVTKNFEHLEAEKARRLQELQEVEEKIRGVESLIQTSQNDLFQLRNAVDHLQNEERTLLTEIRQIDSQIANTRTRLSGLKENTNVLSLYGRDMPMIIEAIKREKNKFTHMPRGPLGSYITLKDKKWAVAVEGFLSPSLLRAFTVDNRNDNELLMQIFNRICKNGPKPMVITSKFFSAVHNVSSNIVRPVDGCISVYDAIEISDPIVANCLIDQVSLESVLLITDNQKAIKLMSNRREVPVNCRQGITMKGDKYYPDPNYKTYASRYTNAQYLQVSMADMIQQLEQNLRDLMDKKESVTSQHQSVKKDFAEQTQNSKASEIKVNKLNRALLHLRRSLSDLQNVDEPLVENLAKMKDELRELNDLVKRRNEVQEKITADLDDFKRRIASKEEKLDRIKVIVRGYEDRIEQLNVQLNEKQGKLRNYEVNRRFANGRVQDCKKRLKQADLSLKEKVNLVEQKTLAANQTGPKPSVLREITNIAREFNENQRTIAHIESNVEDLQEITKKFEVCKDKNLKVDEFIRDIKNDVKLLRLLVEKCKLYYKHTEDYFITLIQYSFQHVLERGQFQGSLEINMPDKKLNLIVIPQHGSQGIATTSNLSGGERSFSTVAFLYSLWQCNNFPFYFLDEFDVFMDKVNRTKVTEILLYHARKCPDLQFVFLTPQDVSFVNDETVAIHRLADPERAK